MPSLGSTIAASLALGLVLACSREQVIDPEQAAALVRAADMPRAQEQGAALYAAYCAPCHGLHGQGTDLGPPMLDPVQARHHADFAFRRAMEEGVRPHHYDLGSMPPLAELGKDEADALVAYIRWMQQVAGLRRKPG